MHYLRWKRIGDLISQRGTLLPKCCEAPGCENAPRQRHDGKSLCNMHGLRWRKYGALDIPDRPVVLQSVCSIEGCGNPARTRGGLLCEMHYYRLRRRGSIETLFDMQPYEYCQHCGKETGGAKFCGMRCRGRFDNALPVKIPCAVCGQKFVPIGRASVCSAECSRLRKRSADNYRRSVMAGAEAERFSDLEIFERDKWRCGLCGGRVSKAFRYPDIGAATIDHILPIARGGGHTWSNVQLAHFGCNTKKGARLIVTGEQLRLNLGLRV